MKTSRRFSRLAVAAQLALGLCAASVATAQTPPSWPTRPINLVVPFPAGGPTDAVARAVAQKLGESLGQPVIIENKSGAGGNLGAQAVARAAPDGYTLLVGTAALTTSMHLYAKLPYDPMKDLAPVAMLAKAPVFVWVNDTLKVPGFRELMATVKAKPGQFNYSSSAPATLAHLGSLYFFEKAGAQLVHLNYKGSSQATNDFLGGVFPIYFEVAQPVVPHMASGKVRPLAVLASRRSPVMPDVPSVAELGFPAVDAVPFIALLAPAGTPRTIVERLNLESKRALANPEVRARLGGLYVEVSDGGEPAAIGEWMRNESKQWGEVIRRNGLKVD